MKKAQRISLFALALSIATGCDLTSTPPVAEYTGEKSAAVSVAFGSETGAADAGVQAVEIEVTDVVLHRPSDDAWIVLSADSTRIQLTDEGTEIAFDNIPLGLDAYDQVSFVIGGVRVAEGNYWHVAACSDDEIGLIADIHVTEDTLLDLRFDLSRSLTGDTASGWVFTPDVAVEVY